MDKIGLIKLWMLGLGIPLDVLKTEKAEWELKQNPLDGHGLLQAFRRGIYEIKTIKDEQITEAINNLNSPRYQLEFILMVTNKT